MDESGCRVVQMCRLIPNTDPPSGLSVEHERLRELALAAPFCADVVCCDRLLAAAQRAWDEGHRAEARALFRRYAWSYA